MFKDNTINTWYCTGPSAQICDEDVKFYTIANGMCVGQCEGSTLYEVAVDKPCADRACHQT